MKNKRTRLNNLITKNGFSGFSILKWDEGGGGGNPSGNHGWVKIR